MFPARRAWCARPDVRGTDAKCFCLDIPGVDARYSLPTATMAIVGIAGVVVVAAHGPRDSHGRGRPCR